MDIITILSLTAFAIIVLLAWFDKWPCIGYKPKGPRGEKQ